MLPYYGKPSNLETYPTTPKIYRRGLAKTFFRRGQRTDPERQLNPSEDSDGIACDPPPRKEKKIRFNVCGKSYIITVQQLLRFPTSLLADPEKRAPFYDEENDEFFFDRNRTTFESIYYFYATNGILVFPSKTFSLQLLADDFPPLGLYDNLSSEEKQDRLPIPIALLPKKVISPKVVCRKRFWEICEFPDSSFAARITTLLSLMVILLATVILCIESLPSIRNSNLVEEVIDSRVKFNISNTSIVTRDSNSFTVKYFISRAEEFCIAWFTLELLIRFLVTPEKRRFLLKFLNIVDIVAILPFYIHLIVSAKSKAPPVYLIKVFHISKIFQVLKISRCASTMIVLKKTVTACLSDLWTMVSLTLTGTILFGILVYYCELWDQETEFRSIPHSFWWAVVTITTVGYGDMVPSTLGKCKFIVSVSKYHTVNFNFSK
ncbi:potassium voltage-gated channel subfamily A member 2-like [Stylophora pistillata]|uniref:potassium voltage-gated channel subfamily A member 2-like n=1 Tax=Stylophora pistillata TaxID=50429 RepID=UPI000C04FE0C|nr:potassium voltage-gated channel subfamily A member 2-like [Stylophora pistillata]